MNRFVLALFSPFVLTPAFAQTPGSPAFLTIGGGGTGMDCAGTGNDSLFPSTLSPVLPGSSTTSRQLEVGTWITPLVDGWISGVSFYKSSSSTGVHYADLFDDNGNLVQEATFARETASGWQSVYFTNPVFVRAGTRFFAAYNTPDYYVATVGGLSAGIVNGNLSILSASNSVLSYAAQGTFPVTTDTGTNYFVDVIFNTEPCFSGGFPTQMSTGYSGTLTPSGNINVTTAGTTIQNVDVTGNIRVNANNTKITNCRVTVSTNTANIYIVDGITGTTVRNCELNGLGTGSGSNGIYGQGTFVNNNIYGVENGIAVTGPSTISGNYIHGLLAAGAPHYDGIQIDGGITGITISNNTIVNQNAQTSGVMLDNYRGALSSVTVSNNIIAGGGYPMYCDGTQSAGAMTSIAYTNNHAGSGYYGTTDFTSCTPTYTGTTFDGWSLIGVIGK